MTQVRFLAVGCLPERPDITLWSTSDASEEIDRLRMYLRLGFDEPLQQTFLFWRHVGKG